MRFLPFTASHLRNGCSKSASSRCPARSGTISRLRVSPIIAHPPRHLASSADIRHTPVEPAKPYYVTTPIFYVNASPHIGHLHSLVLTDVIARYARLREPSRKVIFATGTDEHGLKIQQAARAKGVDEQQFCDDVSQRFRNLAGFANISHTDFIRTSEARHHAAVEHFWARLVESGDIYKGTHAGWYSVSDESFYGNAQVAERDGKMVALESGNEVVWEEEETWKFRLGSYREKLKEWANDPQSIQPDAYRPNVLQQLDTLEDLSISRPASRVRWGVPVPGDREQTIYVWVDALVNYLTVLGYPNLTEGWPVDAHVVGKDIVKFHAIHWPALLMSAKLDPPHTVLTHAHWTMSRAKMSKSRGNVVDPLGAIDKYGLDPVRFYLMRVGGSLPVDAAVNRPNDYTLTADYSDTELEVTYRLLADKIGNLVARISSSRLQYRLVKAIERAQQPHTSPDQAFSESPSSSASFDSDEEMDHLFSRAQDDFARRMEAYQITKACEGILDIVVAANKIFTALEPWNSPDPSKALFYAYHSLRVAGVLLQPIMPIKARELLDRLGVPADERRLEDARWPPAGGMQVEGVVDGLKRGRRAAKGHLFPQLL